METANVIVVYVMFIPINGFLAFDKVLETR